MKYLLINFFLFLSNSASSSQTLDQNIILNYKNKLKKFRADVCTAKDSRLFWQYTQETHRTGYFIPSMEDGQVDSHTVQKLLPAVRDKKQWIEQNIKKIKKVKNFKDKKDTFNLLREDLKILVGFKRKFFEEKDVNQRIAIEQLSKKKLQLFFKILRNSFKELYFLQSYGFPADHKTMRRDYDSFKIRTDVAGKKRANEIFFQRKLVEDGVRHPKWRGNDKTIRTLINTTYLRSIDAKNESFIDESLRYDLEWLLDRIYDYLEYDISLLVKRLERWEIATDNMYSFYLGLLNGVIEIEGEKIAVDKFLDGEGRSRQNLKEFVKQKQIEVYEYWSKQEKIDRILFVLDSIILNEVGGTPDPGDLEKEEVLKVVINRSNLKYYSTLSSKDSIYEGLVAKKIPMEKFPWLNLMLKEGEFSFTYYFLSASNHVFCPDMSPRANNIRDKALELGLGLLKLKKMDTLAVRYFSRASMLGRMDMTDLWDGFSPLNEKPGHPIENLELKKKITDHDYEFLYSFTDETNNIYQVIRIGEEIYSIGSNSRIFSYRNPHNFRYFIEK